MTTTSRDYLHKICTKGHYFWKSECEELFLDTLFFIYKISFNYLEENKHGSFEKEAPNDKQDLHSVLNY